MRRPTSGRQGRHSAEANMTPMIDVVFLLIIFFLVSSHLARRESRLQLELPQAATGEADNDPSPRLTINVQANGALLLGPNPIDPPALVERLKAAHATQGDTLRVRLRGDQTAPYAAIEPALAACAEAGVVDIALGVYGAEGRR